MYQTVVQFLRLLRLPLSNSEIVKSWSCGPLDQDFFAKMFQKRTSQESLKTPVIGCYWVFDHPATSDVLSYVFSSVSSPESTTKHQHHDTMGSQACAAGTEVAIVLQIQWFRLGIRCRCGWPRLVGWVGFGCNGQHGDAQLLEGKGQAKWI